MRAFQDIKPKTLHKSKMEINSVLKPTPLSKAVIITIYLEYSNPGLKEWLNSL